MLLASWEIDGWKTTKAKHLNCDVASLSKWRVKRKSHNDCSAHLQQSTMLFLLWFSPNVKWETHQPPQTTDKMSLSNNSRDTSELEASDLITESHWIIQQRFLSCFELCCKAGWLIVWWSQPSRKRVKCESFNNFSCCCCFASRLPSFWAVIFVGGRKENAVQGLVGKRRRIKPSANCPRIYHFVAESRVLSFSSRCGSLPQNEAFFIRPCPRQFGNFN